MNKQDPKLDFGPWKYDPKADWYLFEGIGRGHTWTEVRELEMYARGLGGNEVHKQWPGLHPAWLRWLRAQQLCVPERVSQTAQCVEDKDILTDLAVDLLTEIREMGLGSDPDRIKQIRGIMMLIEGKLSQSRNPAAA